MNSGELYKAVAEKVDVQNVVAERCVKAVVEIVTNEVAVKGGEVSIANLGKFVLAERAEKNGVNPTTGEKIVIPARKVVKFKPAKTLKETIKD